MDIKQLKIIIEEVKMEKPKPPPTHNDHVKAEGFDVISPKVMPEGTKSMGTNTIRNPDA